MAVERAVSTDPSSQSAADRASSRRLGDYLPCAPEALRHLDDALRRRSQPAAAARPNGAPDASRIGETAVDAGLVTRDQLVAALHAQRADRLRACELFARLDDSELAALAEMVSEVTVPGGEEFIRQDTPGDCMYVIASGRVMIYRVDPESAVGESPLGALGPGQTIGEMGHFSDGTRSASARAMEDTQLLRFGYADLPRAFELAPHLAVGFMKIITERLRETNVRYQTSTYKRHLVERSLKQLSNYLDLSADMALGVGIESLIERVVHTASKVMDADRASLFLVNPATGDMWSKVAEGEDGEPAREIRVPAGTGIAGWVAMTGQILNIPDAYDDDRFNQANDKRTGYRTRSILCGPVHNLQGQIVGVIQVINKLSGRRFEPEDETLFKAFAHQAAIAVENFNLYRRLVASNEKMLIMLDVATSVTQTLDLPWLIRKIVTKIAEILECDRSSFFVYDRENEELWSMEATGAAGEGESLKEIRFPATSGLAGHTARTGEVLNIHDAYEDARFNPEFDRKTGYRTKSILCTPVVGRDGKVSGVVQAINKLGGAGLFEEEDIDLLRALSSQIAVALENAQLYAQSVNMRNYLQSVQQSISNSILTLDNDHKVVTANAAALRTFERPAAQVLRRDIRGLLGPRNAELLALIDRVYETHRGAEDDDLQVIVPNPDAPAKPDKTCTVNVRVVPLSDHEGAERGQVIVVEDVTQERRVRSTLTRYMAKDIVERLLNDPGKQHLGGVRSKATVLFSDIRDFTTISENLSAAQTMDFLNQYFTLMVEEVFKHRGTLDKFMGDAMMAVFGIPYPHDDDAVRAVRTALSMAKVLEGFNARRVSAGLVPIKMGVGINTDEIVSGNMGHAKMMNYTVIGDGVNTASRLEGLNKFYGTQILISDSTLADLGGRFRTRLVDTVLAKGKVRAVGVHEVLGVSECELTPSQRCYEDGHAAYRGRDFVRALVMFQRGSADDALCRMYACRCEAFLQSPPPPDWDGIWRATDK